MVNTIQHQLKQIFDANRSNTATSPEPRSTLRITLIACLLLIAVALAAYGRTLTTYFIADDFGEVAYVSRIAHGNWNLFWSNWTGNFMQIPGMAVYRPFLLISLLSDYLLYKTNAVGYYATNLLFYIGDVLLLFLVAKKLTQNWGIMRSTSAAFLSAALFAVSPLHCETVSWVVGRVDSSCCLMSLASIYCFLRARDANRALWLSGAVACFFGGLFFKEMAIGVPVLATAISILFPKGSRKEIIPLWIATAAYFGLRFAVLHTLGGGYTGAIGDGQANAWVQRWLDIHNYERMLLPFGVTLYGPNNPLSGALKFLYASAITLVALKIFKREFPMRHVLLLAAWMLSAALPIYKLWGIGMDIEGARFVFFLTVPLCMALPFILLAPKAQQTSDRAFEALSAVMIVLLGFVAYKTTLTTNSNWVHAGKEVRAVRESALQIANANPDKQLILLGVPKVRAGAHMIYNGATLRTMLEPPFTQPPVAARFLTFDPIFYGPDQYINADRFRNTLSKPNVVGPFVWNAKELKFDKVNPPAEAQYDFVEFNCKITDASVPIRFTVTLSDDEKDLAERIVAGNGEHAVRIPVSHYWKWFTAKTAIKPIVHSSAPQLVDIGPAKFVRAAGLRPALNLPKSNDDGSGVYAIDPGALVVADASSIAGAKQVLVECSKPNYFFDQIPEADQKTAVLDSFTVNSTTFSGVLPPKLLPKNEYCELRVRALDEHGKPLGEYSDPAIVYLK
jgi:hypothetical protein